MTNNLPSADVTAPYCFLIFCQLFGSDLRHPTLICVALRASTTPLMSLFRSISLYGVYKIGYQVCATLVLGFPLAHCPLTFLIHGDKTVIYTDYPLTRIATTAKMMIIDFFMFLTFWWYLIVNIICRDQNREPAPPPPPFLHRAASAKASPLLSNPPMNGPPPPPPLFVIVAIVALLTTYDCISAVSSNYRWHLPSLPHWHVSSLLPVLCRGMFPIWGEKAPGSLAAERYPHRLQRTG